MSGNDPEKSSVFAGPTTSTNDSSPTFSNTTTITPVFCPPPIQHMDWSSYSSPFGPSPFKGDSNSSIFCPGPLNGNPSPFVVSPLKGDSDSLPFDPSPFKANSISSLLGPSPLKRDSYSFPFGPSPLEGNSESSLFDPSKLKSTFGPSPLEGISEYSLFGPSPLKPDSNSSPFGPSSLTQGAKFPDFGCGLILPGASSNFTNPSYNKSTTTPSTPPAFHFFPQSLKCFSNIPKLPKLAEKISPRPTSNLQVDQNSSLWGRQWGSRGRTCSPTPAIEFMSPPDAKFHSISAIPFFQRKSHEEIRWEDYQSQEKYNKGQARPSLFPLVTTIPVLVLPFPGTLPSSINHNYFSFQTTPNSGWHLNGTSWLRS